MRNINPIWHHCIKEITITTSKGNANQEMNNQTFLTFLPRCHLSYLKVIILPNSNNFV